MSVVSLNANEKKGLKRVVEGQNCAILMATVARLYKADPDPSSWTYTGIMGCVCLVYDKNNPALSIRIFNLRTFNQEFKQELYEDFRYDTPRPYFHSFEGDEFVIGLAFCDTNEAGLFAQKVIKNSPRPGMKMTLAKDGKKAGGGKAAAKKSSGGGWFGGKKKSDEPRLEISGPTGFQHLGHIGWDPNQGFDVRNIPPEWRKVFDKAGLTEADLQDQRTAETVMNFMASQGRGPPQGGGGGPPPPPGGGYGGGGPGYGGGGGGRGGPPPPPPGGGYGGGGRGGPPPPPPGGGYGGGYGGGGGRGGPPPPPPPGGGYGGGGGGGYGAPPPPPPPGGGFGGGGGYGAPPPPPPPPMMGGGPPPPPPPPPPMGGGGGGGGGGGKSGLLSSIQNFGGVGNLNKVEEQDYTFTEEESGDMANLLLSALKGRRGDIGGGSDEEAEEWENDDEWED